MAKQFSNVRKTLYGIAAVFAGVLTASVEAQDLGTPLGTTEGIVNPSPIWSMGLQIGSQETTGLSAQLMGFAGGAANFGLGVWSGDLGIHGDYLWFLGEGFAVHSVPEKSGYRFARGQLLPYVGAGMQILDGIYFRSPMGVQYTLIKDPLNLFGGLTVIVGSRKRDEKIGVDIGLALGVRLLL